METSIHLFMFGNYVSPIDLNYASVTELNALYNLQLIKWNTAIKKNNNNKT